MRRKGAIALAQGLKNNQMLKVLNLSYNGFGTDGAITLAEALKLNTTLTELDITWVFLTITLISTPSTLEHQNFIYEC